MVEQTVQETCCSGARSGVIFEVEGAERQATGSVITFQEGGIHQAEFAFEEGPPAAQMRLSGSGAEQKWEGL